MTKISWNRDISVMMSSVMPSVKYSCSGSADMLVKGSTAIDGLSGNGGGAVRTAMEAPMGAALEAPVAIGVGFGAPEGIEGKARLPRRDQSAADQATRKARTGRSMFFSSRMPRSS